MRINNRQPAIGGVRLQIFNLVMAAAAVILSLLLIRSAYATAGAYAEMDETLETYLICSRSAEQMQNGSDYLTQEVRQFAVTGDLADLQAYFTEANETRSRERALETLGAYLVGEDAYRLLEDALAHSNELMELEYDSMRLVIAAQGYPLGGLPAALQSRALSPAEAALSPEEQMELARSLVFDDAYQSYKDSITANVNSCLDTLIDGMRARQQDSSRQLLSLLRIQNTLTAVLMIVALAVVALTAVLIVQPLRQDIEHVKAHRELPEKGAYELRYMARTYNQMLSKTRQHQDRLSYQAEHDPLTGLYNRGVFERVRGECDTETSAMLLIDIDHFKSINDTYGHEIGDLVLKRLAGVLQHSFRSDDYVCRAGGDEFAVIMVNVGAAMRGMIADKVRRINEAVQQKTDDAPAFSLSIGIAFGESLGEGADLYQNADAALYRVKEAGRCGYAFFDDTEAVSSRIENSGAV